MRAAIAILFIFTFSLSGKTQPVTTCLKESVLLKLQSSSYIEINNFLRKEGWSRIDDNVNQTERYFGYHLDYSVAVWQNRSTSYIESKLFLYHKQNTPNLLIYQAINECFTDLRNGQLPKSQIKTENKDFISFSYTKNNGIVFEFRNYKNDYSSVRFTVLVFNAPSLNKEINAEKERIATELARIKAEEEARFKAIADSIAAERERERSLTANMKQADALYQEGRYTEALNLYEKAINILLPGEKSYLTSLSSKIKKCREGINLIMIMKMIAEGDSCFKQKEFRSALSFYENAIQYFYSNPPDSNHVINVEIKIKEKIDSTNNFLNVLTLIKTEQSYLSFKPSDFSKCRDENIRIIDEIIHNLNKQGNFNYKAVIKFDTLGVNKSYVQVGSVSSDRIIHYLNKINFSELAPVQILDHYIPAKEEIPFIVSWNKFPLSARSRSTKINISPDNSNVIKFKHNIGSFINNQKYQNGIYKFQVINKNINGTSSDEVSLTKYINNSGPLNSAYSLLMPGLGSLRVTDGEKGAGVIKTFLLASIISAGSKIYSDIEYDKYLKTSPESVAVEHHELANTANKVFLISGGIAATIYIYDFFRVISKGISNNKQSKVLKDKLKSGPIKIY